MSLNKIGQADEDIMDLCSLLDSDLLCEVRWGFPGSSTGKEFTCNVGDLSLIPGLRRFPGGRHDNHSSVLALRIPMDRRATVRGIAKS